ncbi:ERI1 exoribonuclease 3 [Anthophora plagiata]
MFHEYIKPRFNPKLTVFCTELTGIMQDLVDNQPHFSEVFEKFCKWLKENNYSTDENDSAFVTCGDWDLKYMLPSQCKLENMSLPPQFSKWINLKTSFCDATEFYPRNLVDMLSHFDLPLHGRLHSGINDVENMVKIIQNLHSKYNFEFKINSMQGDILRKFIKSG